MEFSTKSNVVAPKKNPNILRLLGRFRLTEQSIENLKTDNLPDEVLNKLKTILNKEFGDKEKFRRYVVWCG